MRIAFVHYHLRPGGVTSVLYHQAELLKNSDEILIIAGEAGGPGGEGSGGIALAVVEALRYDQHSGTTAMDAEFLAGALLKAMEDHWGTAADILHVHNPLIRKNSALIPALKILSLRGIRLLLQNHDLAEDFRPDVYTPEEYPLNCHYGVINSRDYSFLHRAGLKPEGLHLIPNEVASISAIPGLERKRYLYPVRGIRRKNIGEALLLSLFIPPGKTVALTLPPTVLRDAGIYREWVRFAGELELPVEFETGVSHSLPELLGSALCVITTSVKEGFGFSYLEPWTADRPVIGRRIEYVCRDFEEAGVRFNALYKALLIPEAYISPPALKHKIEKTMTAVYKAFGLEVSEYVIKMLEEMPKDAVDFGCLDEEMQKGVIRALASNRAVYRDILDANPFLAGLGDLSVDETLIASNKEQIQKSYGKERIRDLLQKTYQAVMNTEVIHKLSKSILLELYLDPRKLFLVGVGRD